MGFKVEGIERLVRRLEATPARVNARMADELEDVGADLKAVSQSRAPMLTGELRAQAYSEVYKSPGGASVEVGYDGPPEYLLVQHEGGWKNLKAWGNSYGPTRIENYTTPGTSSKFLENPWTEGLPSYKRRVREAVRKGLSG